MLKMGCSKSTNQNNFIYGLKEAYHLIYHHQRSGLILNYYHNEILAKRRHKNKTLNIFCLWNSIKLKISPFIGLIQMWKLKNIQNFCWRHILLKKIEFQDFCWRHHHLEFFSFNIKGIFGLHLWLKFGDFSSSQ